MKFSTVAILAFASTSFGAAIESRGRYAEVLMTCPTGGSTVGAAAMAGVYSRSCRFFYHCAHSVAPILANNEWIGSCLDCPTDLPEASDGCVLVPQ
ncbi:hypothetical protein F53441_8688 [Fusarium austroafricanum]|uniref:Uncharacterized protein n=1 Tax=Fusarium austroafricanum TaxID=2364996 RepID=A0A8H4KCB3_9HYPO|nr:hypothetical protein F53441_8688 [Fusarium austroafricanum]